MPGEEVRLAIAVFSLLTIILKIVLVIIETSASSRIQKVQKVVPLQAALDRSTTDIVGPKIGCRGTCCPKNTPGDAILFLVNRFSSGLF